MSSMVIRPLGITLLTCASLALPATSAFAQIEMVSHPVIQGEAELPNRAENRGQIPIPSARPIGTQGNGVDSGASQWDDARANLVAQGPSAMTKEITRWQQLTGNSNLSFNDYAAFLIRNPGFPNSDQLRGYAEGRLREEFVPPNQLLAFFAAYEPVTNFARAHYALALGAEPQKAQAFALSAWRGGEMSETAEAALSANYGSSFTRADQDARMDALLWQRDRAAAERQFARTSTEKQPIFAARLAILKGGDGAISDARALTDAGYLYNRSRELRLEGKRSQGISMLANRPALSNKPFNQTAWVTEMLNVAKLGGASSAAAIAAKMDDAFEPGEDISKRTYRLRDDYTSLMWLGGTKALWELGDGRQAAPLFYRYGAAARTPQTRSKGFFWAGHAAQQGGDVAEATRYYEMAATYPARFYGQLALGRLGRKVPSLSAQSQASPTAQQRAAFNAAPLTAAVAEVARDAPWAVGIRFYRSIADKAETPAEHVLVAELAREIGRRDLAVNLAEAAQAHGYDGFVSTGHPRLNLPAGTNWTLVHAITRQESQFAQNAISHAGARGLMQLMPATAREEAGKAGVRYMRASLIDDASYNMRLGSNHIERLVSYYDGSYPLAFAAYNAGPGNVNKWLRANGDPRKGGISWIKWIEKIPFFETKNYVQRVVENAVVYETLYPEYSAFGRARTVEELLQ